jgi:hypothetical protein
MAGAGMKYASSPVITYAPISGETVKNILLRPIPVDDIFKALETGWYPKFILPYCVQSVNHLQNDLRDEGFFRLVQLWQELRDRKAIHVTFEKEKNESASEDSAAKTKGKDDSLAGKDKLVDNLVTFTSKLVQEQKKKVETDEEKKESIYISFDSGAPRIILDNVSENDLANLKAQKPLECLDNSVGNKIFEKIINKSKEPDFLIMDDFKGNKIKEELMKEGISEDQLSDLNKQLSALQIHAAMKDASQVVDAFKKKLGLIRLNLNTTTKEKLLGLRCIKELDWLGLDKIEKIINKQNKGRNYTIADFTSVGLSEKQQKALEPYVEVRDNIVLGNNRFKVEYGYPPEEQCPGKIYVHPDSVLGSLTFASKFIKVPTEERNRGNQGNKNIESEYCSYTTQYPIKSKPGYPDKVFPDPEAFADVSMKICSSSNEPSTELASVKIEYRDSWFYIRNDDLNSKDVFSSMVGILTMMDTGKKDAPTLTLPVR